jgi:hypothetical protein
MKKIAIAVAACAALACGGKRVEQKPLTVSDSDYGRLQAGQTQLVDAARADLARARDEHARAKLRQTEAINEDQLAQADLQAAEAAKTRADSMARSANESRAPAQLEQARTAAETAQLRQRAADAHMDHARKLQRARAAQVGVAERRVAYESARVELAKLQSLQQAQVPAASKYDARRLEAQVAKARKELEQAEGEVRKSEAEVTAAERTWQELDRQLKAQLGQAR